MRDTQQDTTEAQLAYSIKQAAQKTGYSESTIRRALDEGHLAAVSPKGVTKPVIRHQALDAWLNGE